MGFSEFLGNERIVASLRRMLARDRAPSALLFTGPRGIGKYTLARMFAQAANCRRLRDDFCGECPPCLQIARLADPGPLIEQGLAERGESADAATVERTPLLLRTHPDVCVAVPDPVRLRNPVARPLIRVGQLRAIQHAAYFQPDERRRVFILDGADTMRWSDAHIFLKILEEPPESATLILLAPRPDSLLLTIRSRCLQFHFAPVPAAQVEHFLEKHSEWKPAERRLAAQLSAGAPGAALALDLDDSLRLRREALSLISRALEGRRFHDLFALTAQLTKSEKQDFENLFDVFYSFLTDLLELACSKPGRNLRNPDLGPELEALSRRIDYSWVLRATAQLDDFSARLRRNVGRQLGLDAWALSLERAGSVGTLPRS